MKKFLLSSLAVLGMSGMAFAGDGTEASPYDVDQIIAMGVNADVKGVYVEGYIVGSVGANEGKSYPTDCVFGVSPASQTNVMIASSSTEDSPSYCIPVQLPSGSVRNGLNLQDNPANLGHKVVMKGDIIKYFSVPGFKNVTSYTWIGEAPEGGNQGGGNEGGNTGDGNFATGTAESPLTVTEFLAQGIPSAAVAGTYLTGYIVGCVPGMSISDGYIGVPEDNGTTNNGSTNLLLGATAGETVVANCVVVALPGGAVREALNLIANPDNLGKEVTLYGSHEKYFGGNGLKSVTKYWWGSKGEAVDTPDQPGDQPNTPTDVISVAEVLKMMAEGYRGTAQVKGYVTKIDEETSNPAQYGDINYYISDDLQASNEFYIYNGYGLNGQHFTSTSELPIGALVVVEGTCSEYNGVYEFARGSKIISLNGETGGGDTPTPPVPDQPGDVEGLEQPFDKGLGFPEGSANVPKEATSYTASDTDITYEIFGAYVNAGYLMLNGKNYENAYISWSLDFPMSRLAMVTTDGCSENAQSQVNVYANGTLVQGGIAVNVHSATVVVNIPAEYQAAGTVYKVESNTNKYNQQFSKFIYVNAQEDGVETVLAADDSEAVYYNLQGQKVANPDRGIFIKVVGNKAVKVVR